MEDRQKVYMVVAVVAIATVLLSCVVGAVAGALAGYVTGQRQARSVSEWEVVPQEEAEPFFRMPMPGMGTPMPRFEMPDDIEGAVIIEVFSGTPADEVDLRTGDVIVTVDRAPVDENHDLAALLAQYEPGDRVALGVWRAGKSMNVRVTLAEHPDRPRQPYLGIRYSLFTRPGFDLPGG
jgi:S1-C subfamily serine protease